MTAAQGPLSAAQQEWVAGWYWRTDEQGQLVCFRPGLASGDVRLQGHVLSEHMRLRPAWLALWDIAQHQSEGWQQMAYLMSQGLSWSQGLLLPWPGALPGWWPPRDADLAQVRVTGCVLKDAHGKVIGHEGVCQPVLPAVSLSDSPSTGPAAGEPAMTAAEQEALHYALSHDLRAPLRVVDGFSRIVKEDFAVALGKLGLDHIDRVLAASARMSGMIDAILAQAQLGSATLQRQQVSLSDLAQEVCAELSAGACAGQVHFEVEPGLSVEADPVLLRRVIDNLMGNAVKYSAKVAEPRVAIGRVPATNPAVFFVRDNGAGFDMQHADKLFGMFQRLHSAKEFPGTGVGLAGVQQIVRRHGGRIWAEAKPGEGACFYFTLMDASTAQPKLV